MAAAVQTWDLSSRIPQLVEPMLVPAGFPGPPSEGLTLEFVNSFLASWFVSYLGSSLEPPTVRHQYAALVLAVPRALEVPAREG
jgi:hypothetical protein